MSSLLAEVEWHAHGVDAVDARAVAILRQHRVDIAALLLGSVPNAVELAGIASG
jgi:hypothetical protein